MPTIKYTVNEVTEIIKKIAEDASQDLHIEYPRGLRCDVSWVHKDEERNESRVSKDFSPYDSSIEITFNERF